MDRPPRVAQTRSLPGSAGFFDAVAGEYQRWYEAATPGGYALRVRRQRLLELLDCDSTKGRLLDVGCGPGVLIPELLARGYRVWGVDAAPQMIARCLDAFEPSHARFAVGDASRLGFADGLFDTVVCLGVIDRIRPVEAAIREMLRVAKVNGHLLISFPNLCSPYAMWRNFVFYPTVRALRPIHGRLGGKRRPSLSTRTPATLHTPWGAVRMLTGLGARVTDVVFFYFNPCLSPLDEMASRLSVTVSERLERLRFSSLRWLGAGFIVRAERTR